MSSIYAALIVTIFAVVHLLFGGGDGNRLIYVLPGYLLLGAVGVLTIISLRKSSARLDRGCLVAVLLLAAYTLVRTALSPVAYLAGLERFAVLAALLIYFIQALFVTGMRQRTAMLCSLLVLGLGQVAVGIYQFAREPNFNPLVADGRGEGGFRASGLFISPNHLAGFLEVALILGTSICLWGGFRVFGRMVLGYLTLACLAGLVLTGSRGGYLSATAGMAVFALLSAMTARGSLSEATGRRVIAIIAVLVVAGGMLAFVANHSVAIRGRANTVFVSEDIRLSLWEAAWKQFKLAPVFGTGSRTYAYYGRMFRAPEVQRDPVFAHSDWLQTLAEYGVAGIALLGAFVFSHLRHAAKTWHATVGQFSPALASPDEKNELALQIGSISAIAACLVHAVMDFNLHIPANMLLLAWLFGIIATVRTEPDEAVTGWPRGILHAVPAGLGVWMLLAGGPILPGEIFVEAARGKFAAAEIGPAVKDAGEAIGRGARNPELYFQLGEVQQLLAQRLRSPDAKTAAIEEAYEMYAEAISIYPQDVKLVLRAAWALDRLGRFDEAEKLFSNARELDPNSLAVWTFSALHWHLQNKPAAALADYLKAVKLGGGYVTVVLAELGEKLVQQELEKAAAQ